MKEILIKKYPDWPIEIVSVKKSAKKYGKFRLSSIYICDYDARLNEYVNRHNSYIAQVETFVNFAIEELNEIKELSLML